MVLWERLLREICGPLVWAPADPPGCRVPGQQCHLGPDDTWPQAGLAHWLGLGDQGTQAPPASLAPFLLCSRAALPGLLLRPCLFAARLRLFSSPESRVSALFPLVRLVLCGAFISQRQTRCPPGAVEAPLCWGGCEGSCGHEHWRRSPSCSLGGPGELKPPVCPGCLSAVLGPAHRDGFPASEDAPRPGIQGSSSSRVSPRASVPTWDHALSGSEGAMPASVSPWAEGTARAVTAVQRERLHALREHRALGREPHPAGCLLPLLAGPAGPDGAPRQPPGTRHFHLDLVCSAQLQLQPSELSPGRAARTPPHPAACDGPRSAGEARSPAGLGCGWSGSVLGSR